MLSVIFSYFSSIAANKFQIKKNRALNPLQRKYEYVKRMLYTGNAAADTKTTNVHDLLLKEECEANLEIENTQKRYIFKLFKINWLSANILGRMPFLIMGVEALLTHIYTLGDTAVMISSINNISQTLDPLANMYPQMQKNSEYIDDYIKYMETQGELGENPEGGRTEEIANGLRLKNVSLSYDGESDVLKDMDMEIGSGERVAIVGKNGAGKSTLLKLLLRLYEPQGRQTGMDGRPVQQYNLKAYRERFGVAFQNTQLYSAPVAENVMM